MFNVILKLVQKDFSKAELGSKRELPAGRGGGGRAAGGASRRRQIHVWIFSNSLYFYFNNLLFYFIALGMTLNLSVV